MSIHKWPFSLRCDDIGFCPRGFCPIAFDMSTHSRGKLRRAGGIEGLFKPMLSYSEFRQADMTSKNENSIPVEVLCHAGYRGEESPRRLWLGENTVEVVEVLDRWMTPDYRYFKISGDDDAEYIIRHDTEADRWSLTFYKALK
jgi:hypothetical protein